MLRLTIIIIALLSFACSSTKNQPYLGNLSFVPIPEAQDLRASGRGAEQWHDQNAVPIFFGGESEQYSLDKYFRFSWSQIEIGPGQYDWSIFDGEVNDAIDNNQTFSFGIMPTCPSCTEDGKSILIDGKIASYPVYLHDQMQKEDIKDWVSPVSGMWVPNWNSPSYLAALERLNKAVANRLATQEYKGVKYKDIIRYIDLRGFGTYGEWHEAAIVETTDDHPKGTQATAESLRKIVDIHLEAYKTFRLVALMGSLDADLLRNTRVPTEVGHYILTAKTDAGPLGIRRDNWGSTDNYIKTYMENHPVQYQGLSFREAIAERWKTAPIVGEPIHDLAPHNECPMGDIENQVRKYHASSIGNGNFFNPDDGCLQEKFRAAARAAGFRLTLAGGQFDSAIVAGNNHELKLYWKNEGIAPLYEKWEVHYQLSDLRTNSIVLETKSSFSPTLLLPSDTATPHTDILTIPADIPAGHYNLRLIIRDPLGYRSPLPLAIQGRQPDGSYDIRSVEVLAAP